MKRSSVFAKFFLCFVISSQLLLSSCGSVPLTGRKQVLLVSEQEVLEAGLTQYNEYMAEATLSTNAKASAMVSNVGKKLAQATEKYLKANGLESEIGNLTWEFSLVQNNEVNAFCLPNGKIVFYEGIMQYADTPQETAILLNTPFSLMKSLENTTFVHPYYFSNEEAEAIFSPIHCDEIKGNGRMGHTNVVVLILESFSKEYIGFYNQHIDEYEGYTPFLDSLLTHCVTYTHSFASGRKSIDAMPSVLSSIPMVIEPYIVTPYSTNAVSSLAACLRNEGYTTAFFHGAPNGSMGFQAYARSAGFEHYYGMDEYDGIEAFDGTWAIWDEEFLQYYARTMSHMQQPFMTAVFTASSHHPFRVPKQYEGVFPTGTHPIHPCVGYTDHALREFFAYAQQQDWYENTLFVLTADHTNQVSLPEYATAKGLFEVPIAFYSPRWNQGELRSIGAISQTDIMPSVLAYLGYSKPFFAFGEDALTQAKKHPYAVCYNHPVYQLLSDSLLMQFDGEKVRAVYDYQHDAMLQNNLANQLNTKDMETYLRAYIQQYIYRLTTNQLTVETDGSTRR